MSVEGQLSALRLSAESGSSGGSVTIIGRQRESSTLVVAIIGA